ncbi:VWA domain-containing protein [Singulisphaera sp. PoT]|uniref:VWA domain-containing protein n=1 Tax=Singulisphaera sp. PoT TaxID=3411797 RepID=UPI003BF4EED2
MRIPPSWKWKFVAAAFGLAVLVAGSAMADGPALSFEKVVEYLDLEVKESKILKIVNDSPTVFTLGADQVKLLKSKGASDALIEALQKKGKNDAKAVASSDFTDFALILDCSGSMRDRTADGKSKWDVAKQAALDLIEAIPDGRQLAFITYGHNKEQACEAAEILRPLESLDAAGRQELAKMIDQIQPVGNTPIALAISKADEALKSATGLAKVVLITDGMETCSGDPVKAAATLVSNEKVKGGVNVIGFDLNEQESAAVSNIAKAGKGEFYAAKKAADLVRTIKVVSETIAEPVDKRPTAEKSNIKPSNDPSKPAPLELGKYAGGRLGEGKAHHFVFDGPAGEYVLVGDIERSDKRSSNLQFVCQVDGDRAFATNDIDWITRGAAKVKLEPGKHVITVSNGSSIVDYRFGVFKSDAVPSPHLGRASLDFHAFEVGKAVPVKLDPKSIDTRTIFLRTKLEAGDYTISFQFASPQASGNFGAYLDEANEYGVDIKRIGSRYSSEKLLSIESKLILADEQDLLLRVQVNADDPIEGNLIIKPLDEAR